MNVPGDRRPGRPTGGVWSPDVVDEPSTAAAWSPLVGIAVAIGVGLVAALAWAVLRGILELSVGLLVVSALGGWGIGMALRRSLPSRGLASILGAAAWLLSLVLTWVVTRITLLSDRPLDERLAQTPFLDFTTQQFGLLDVVSLVLFVGAAIVGVGRTVRGS